MRILLVTDTSASSLNGLAVTVSNVAQELRSAGHDVMVLNPYLFFGIPFFGGVKLVFPLLGKKIKKFNPYHVHIFTEGPLGLAARQACLFNEISFTTGYYTKFPKIQQKLFFVPQCIIKSYLEWFHKPSKNVLVPNEAVKDDLLADWSKSSLPVSVWERGIDNKIFYPRFFNRKAMTISGNHLMCISRVTAEKGLDDFCNLSNHGFECTLIGSGPLLPRLKSRYPKVIFTGSISQARVAVTLRRANVLVFPAKNNIFCLVMLEANACGVPVVAYPVRGPKEWIVEGKNGFLAPGMHFEDLKVAVLLAQIQCSPARCFEFSFDYSWKASAAKLLTHFRRSKRFYTH
jgi:glycosyltransferase involved in cell wall biosynthesis